MKLEIKNNKQLYLCCFISFLIGFFLAFSLVVLNEDDCITENKEEVISPINQTVIVGSDDSETNKININTATEKELSNLSGIGENKALTIIEYREKNGSFSNVSELLNVTGIGNSTYEKIKDMVVVE